MGGGGHDPYHPTAGGGVHQPRFKHEHDLDHYHPHHLPHKKVRSLKLSWRAKLFLTFEEPEYSYTARFVSFVLNCCIFLSVIAFILGTMAPFKHQPHECHAAATVGHVCYGPNGEITEVVNHHGAAEGTAAGEAGGAGAGAAAHHRWLKQQQKPLPQWMESFDYLTPYEEDQDEDPFYHYPVPQPPLAPKRVPRPRPGQQQDARRKLAPEVAAVEHAPDAVPEEGGPAVTDGAEHGAAAATEPGHGHGHAAAHGMEEGCHAICEPEPAHSVEAVEYFAMAFFTIDYLIRLLCVHAVPYRLLDSNDYHRKRAKGHYREPSGLSKMVHHFFHAMNLIDLLALAPFYFRTLVEKVFPEAMESGILRVFRLLRVFRIAPFYMHMVVSTHGVVKSGDNPHFMHMDLTWFFDLLKIGDYAEGAPLIFWTVKSSWPAVAVAIVATVILTIAMGTLMFLAEHGAFQVTQEYPKGAFLVHENYTSSRLVEAPHASILMSMWYIVSDTTTMPSVDMLVPHTTSGMIIDVIVDYVALMIITLPIAIVIRNFHEQYEYFFKRFDEDYDEWSDEMDDEDNDEAIIFGFMDESNLQPPKRTDSDANLACIEMQQKQPQQQQPQDEESGWAPVVKPQAAAGPAQGERAQPQQPQQPQHQQPQQQQAAARQQGDSGNGGSSGSSRKEEDVQVKIQ